MKNLFAVCFCLFLGNNLLGQEYATDKGAIIIGGAASFSSSSGDLYEILGEKVTNITIIPSIDYFLFRNFFIGTLIQYNQVKQFKSSISTFGAGPDAGFVFGKPGSKVLPFVSGGFIFLNERSKTYDSSNQYIDRAPSTELDFGAGFIIPVHNHIGITISGVYRKRKANFYKGEILAMTVGINGLLFKERGKEK